MSTEIAVFSAALLAVGLSWSNVASAQDDAPDVVRMANGGMLRGTLIEYDPSSHVRVRLPGGEERTIPADEVEWAGPAAEMPTRHAPANPPPPVAEPAAPRSPRSRAAASGTPSSTSSRTATVRIVSQPDAVAVHLRTGERPAFRIRSDGVFQGWRSEYDPVTTWGLVCPRTPCHHDFALGSYVIGVSDSPSGTPEQLRGVLSIDGPTRVEIHRESHRTLRVLGGVVMVLVGLTGLITTAVGTVDCGAFECRDPFPALLGVGIPLLAVSLAVGIPLLALEDTLSWEATPLRGY